jgi:SPP1 family predicted phage head-tail adaptor
MLSPKLDRKIRLERFTFTVDEGSGEQVKTWSELATVWASKRDVSDSERVASAEVSAEIGTRWQIRWDSAWSNLSPLDRLVYEGRTFEIVAVKELGRREGIEISSIARAETPA